MTDAIDKVVAMDDPTLMTTLGLKQQLDEFKEAAKEAATLTGDARKKVAESLERQLTPRVYPSELKYEVERAKRKATDGPTPASMVDCCCGDD